MRRVQLNRRRLLQAGAVTLALPWLETTSMGASSTPPTRLVTSCATLGLYADSWFPKTEGANYQPSEYLNYINQNRSQFTLFSGLEHSNQSGRQPHNSEVTWLTSAEHPGLDGFHNSLSLDQAVAEHYGYVTRFPSITLGTNSPQSQSYTSGGVMLPAEVSPSSLFKRLFLQGDAAAVAREEARLRDGASILDQVLQETGTLLDQVSHSDRQKLSSYFTAVRSAESELAEVKAWQTRPKPVVKDTVPDDIVESNDLIGRIRLMYDLIPLALETDSTRSISLMIQDHGVVIKHPGVTADLHNLSHHGQDEHKISQLRMVETEIVKLLASLLERLNQVDDHGTRLLDSTIVLFGSNLGNANSHQPTDLPILVAGGSLPHGKHHVYSGENKPPLSNLYLKLIQHIGIETDSFGHSNGTLEWA